MGTILKMEEWKNKLMMDNKKQKTIKSILSGQQKNINYLSTYGPMEFLIVDVPFISWESQKER